MFKENDQNQDGVEVPQAETGSNEPGMAAKATRGAFNVAGGVAGAASKIVGAVPVVGDIVDAPLMAAKAGLRTTGAAIGGKEGDVKKEVTAGVVETGATAAPGGIITNVAGTLAANKIRKGGYSEQEAAAGKGVTIPGDSEIVMASGGKMTSAGAKSRGEVSDGKTGGLVATAGAADKIIQQDGRGPV